MSRMRPKSNLSLENWGQQGRLNFGVSGGNHDPRFANDQRDRLQRLPAGDLRQRSVSTGRLKLDTRPNENFNRSASAEKGRRTRSSARGIDPTMLRRHQAIEPRSKFIFDDGYSDLTDDNDGFGQGRQIRHQNKLRDNRHIGQQLKQQMAQGRARDAQYVAEARHIRSESNSHRYTGSTMDDHNRRQINRALHFNDIPLQRELYRSTTLRVDPQTQERDSRISKVRSPTAFLHGANYKSSYDQPRRSRVASFDDEDDGVSSIGFSPPDEDRAFSTREQNNDLVAGRGNRDLQELNIINDVRNMMQSPRQGQIRVTDAPQHSARSSAKDRQASLETKNELDNSLKLPLRSSLDRKLGENINNAAEWSRLLSWLVELGLDQYASNFREGGITQLSVVELLQEGDLGLLGIAPEHRPKILSSIGAFSSRTRNLARIAMTQDGPGPGSMSPLQPGPRASAIKPARLSGQFSDSTASRPPQIADLNSQSLPSSTQQMASELVIANLLQALDAYDYDRFMEMWTEATRRLPPDFCKPPSTLSTQDKSSKSLPFSGYMALQSLHFNIQLHFAVAPLRQNHVSVSDPLAMHAMNRFRKVLELMQQSEREDSPVTQIHSLESDTALFTSTREFAQYSGIVFSSHPASNPLYSPLFELNRQLALRNKCELFFQLTGLAYGVGSGDKLQSTTNVNVFNVSSDVGDRADVGSKRLQLLRSEVVPDKQISLESVDSKPVESTAASKGASEQGSTAIRKAPLAKVTLKDVIRKPDIQPWKEKDGYKCNATNPKSLSSSNANGLASAFSTEARTLSPSNKQADTAKHSPSSPVKAYTLMPANAAAKQVAAPVMSQSQQQKIELVQAVIRAGSPPKHSSSAVVPGSGSRRLLGVERRRMSQGITAGVLLGDDTRSQPDSHREAEVHLGNQAASQGCEDFEVYKDISGILESEQEWLYSKSGRALGPVARQFLFDAVLFEEGIDKGTFVWCKGMESWKPMREVPEFGDLVMLTRTYWHVEGDILEAPVLTGALFGALLAGQLSVFTQVFTDALIYNPTQEWQCLGDITVLAAIIRKCSRCSHLAHLLIKDKRDNAPTTSITSVQPPSPFSDDSDEKEHVTCLSIPQSVGALCAVFSQDMNASVSSRQNQNIEIVDNTIIHLPEAAVAEHSEPAEDETAFIGTVSVLTSGFLVPCQAIGHDALVDAVDSVQLSVFETSAMENAGVMCSGDSMSAPQQAGCDSLTIPNTATPVVAKLSIPTEGNNPVQPGTDDTSFATACGLERSLPVSRAQAGQDALIDSIDGGSFEQLPVENFEPSAAKGLLSIAPQAGCDSLTSGVANDSQREHNGLPGQLNVDTMCQGHAVQRSDGCDEISENNGPQVSAASSDYMSADFIFERSELENNATEIPTGFGESFTVDYEGEKQELPNEVLLEMATVVPSDVEEGSNVAKFQHELPADTPVGFPSDAALSLGDIVVTSEQQSLQLESFVIDSFVTPESNNPPELAVLVEQQSLQFETDAVATIEPNNPPELAVIVEQQSLQLESVVTNGSATIEAYNPPELAVNGANGLEADSKLNPTVICDQSETDDLIIISTRQDDQHIKTIKPAVTPKSRVVTRPVASSTSKPVSNAAALAAAKAATKKKPDKKNANRW